MKRLFCALFVLVTLPAWAGPIGLDITSAGGLTFKEKKAVVSGNGSIADLGSMPAFGNFSFTTGKFLSSASGKWFYGSGGHVKFSACLDINADGDASKHCDKGDFRGVLFTGVFTKAQIQQTGKNTFMLIGQLYLTPTASLANSLGISAGSFLANINLRFTDTCTASSPLSCRGNITGGKLVSVTPEPTSFVLLAFGMVLAGFGHATWKSFFQPRV